jgi:hypothetical protein
MEVDGMGMEGFRTAVAAVAASSCVACCPLTGFVAETCPFDITLLDIVVNNQNLRFSFLMRESHVKKSTLSCFRKFCSKLQLLGHGFVVAQCFAESK